MTHHKKRDIITFKVDAELSEALQGVGNRSAFIRQAVASALDSTCPLCRGSGILTAEQKEHWYRFAQRHTVEKCPDCHAFHLVCFSEDVNDSP
jgi:DnaJ-class molecular chaperone